MYRLALLKCLYEGLWLSADFEEDLRVEFPDEFRCLKFNENLISTDKLAEMVKFMDNHPVFN